MKTTSKLFSGWSEVTSGERNEIVFERLHKTYGAYEIRTNYDRTLLKAFSATALLIILLSVYIFISGYFSSAEIKIDIPIDNTELRTILEKEKIIIPDEPKVKVTSSPNTNQNTEPIVTDDSEKDEPKITLVNPNNNPNGNQNDTASNNPPFIPSGGGEKYIDPIDTTTFDGVFLQEKPEFPGGDPAMKKFLQNNVIYPQYVKEINGKGIVNVGFTVDKEGNIADVVLLNAAKYQELNYEAMRVVKKMPQWHPGKQQGRAVKVRMNLPIKFDLK